MPETVDHKRRRMIAAAVMTIAAAQARAAGSASLPASDVKGSFGALKQIDAGLLNVGYADIGPPRGHPVVLLHGWPYDIHSYVDAASLLGSAGYRVIVPYLRGYGSTR